MKPMQRTTLFSLLVLLSGIWACSKNPDMTTPPANPPAVAEKLSRIQTGNTISRFVYNNAGDLVQVIDSAADSDRRFITLLEYTQGRLSKSSYGFMTYRFEYPDNQTLVVHTGSMSNPVLDKDVYSYNGNWLVEHIRYYAVTGEPEQRQVFSYNANGNVEKEEDYVYDPQEKQWRKVVTASFSYDERENTTTWLEERLHFFIERNRFRMKNNPVKIDWHLPNNQLLRTHNYQYTYDTKGRKTSRIEEVVANNRVINRHTSFFTYQ